jgi:hypothetical protein
VISEDGIVVKEITYSTILKTTDELTTTVPSLVYLVSKNVLSDRLSSGLSFSNKI